MSYGMADRRSLVRTYAICCIKLLKALFDLSGQCLKTLTRTQYGNSYFADALRQLLQSGSSKEKYIDINKVKFKSGHLQDSKLYIQILFFKNKYEFRLDIGGSRSSLIKGYYPPQYPVVRIRVECFQTNNQYTE